MAARQVPGLLLWSFFDLGEDGWKDEMDENLRVLSALCQCRVISRTTDPLPGSPTDGDMYIVATAGADVNKIALRDNGAWVYIVPSEGFLVHVNDANEFVKYNGSAWASLLSGISFATTTEVLTGTESAKAATPDAIAALWEKGADIASAGTISIGEGGVHHVTGTVTITDIDWATPKDGRTAWLIFDDVLTLTHHATTLKLPGGANITTAAGDRALFAQDSGDNVVCLTYIKADGTPVVPTAASVKFEFEMAISDEVTALTTGTSKLPFYAPMNATITEVFIGLSTQSTSGAVTADLNKNGTTMFSTNPSIEANEDTSLTGTPAVLSTTTWTKGDRMTVDIDAAGTGAKGLKMIIIGTRS